mmetsp:Transcript_7005/g.10567  ORF Transcript_7005/g.10567 Transcript_7005/m.10567 type:complete len:432 (+) Transcript_7005:102-1397(+)
MNNSAVSRCIQSLAGVFRDPSRVSRDASSLLTSLAGRHLHPEASSFVQNDGSTVRSLVLKGTITMLYRGATYNVPIDLHLSPAYPVRPPVVYVRPVSTMMIKEGHRHVAADGMVYMPYLHSWRPHSHNLIDACQNMSSIFGSEPPVFAKPAGYRAPAPKAAAVRPTPPRYEDIAARPPAPAPAPAPTPVSGGFSDIFSKFSGMTAGTFGNLSSSTTTDNNTMSAEERMAVEAAEANTALETARTADAIEEQETRMTQEARNRLVEKSRDILNTYRNAAGNDISDCVKDQLLLDKAKAFVRDEENGQIVYLTKRKEELEVYHKELDKGIQKLTAFVKSAEEEKSSKKEVSVDELAIPSDIHSAQMLILSAENAAINDALYFLDKALADSRISLHVHLIAVRKLTKTQFLVKAHLLKIGQVKASEAITQNAWS